MSYLVLFIPVVFGTAVILALLALSELLPWQYLPVENRLVKKFLTNKYSKSYFNQWKYNLGPFDRRYRIELTGDDRQGFDAALAELDYDPFNWRGMFK